MDEETALLRARDIMSSRVLCLPAEMPIDEALEKLEHAEHSGAPVIEQGRVVGVLSDLDCVRVLATAVFDDEPVGTVADHMTRQLDTLSPEDDVFKITDVILRSGHSQLPVVDAAGGLVGLITPRDLADGLAKLRKHSARPSHPPGAAWDPRRSDARDRRRH